MTSEIPVGNYCYSIIGVDSKSGRIKTKPCPYYSWRIVGENLALPWCDYLNRGSVPIGISEKDYEIVEKYEAHSKGFDLFLLWDQVKECGVNTGD